MCRAGRRKVTASERARAIARQGSSTRCPKRLRSLGRRHNRVSCKAAIPLARNAIGPASHRRSHGVARLDDTKRKIREIHPDIRLIPERFLKPSSAAPLPPSSTPSDGSEPATLAGAAAGHHRVDGTDARSADHSDHPLGNICRWMTTPRRARDTVMETRERRSGGRCRTARYGQLTSAA